MSELGPVIIVGAPRSGTSLLQKIIREHHGFRSVARESDFIWQPYTHPALNEWKYEGWQQGKLDHQERDRILKEFDRYALPARAWRRASALNIMQHQRSPLLGPVLRLGYRSAAILARALRHTIHSNARKAILVDKSVHFPLFLPLVEQVFPDARYIHIIRSGLDTVPSMLDGWLNPDRFFTYEVPGGLAIPDYPHKLWNFALPPRWQEWRARPLADVVAFQWLALQEAVIQHFTRESRAPVLRIHLEELVANPRSTLAKIGSFLELPDSDYMRKLSRGLPRVNARPQQQRDFMSGQVSSRMERLSTDLRERLESLNHALGYD